MALLQRAELIALNERGSMRRIFVAVLFLFFTFTSAQANGFDITKPPFNAIPNDGLDDSAAIEAADAAATRTGKPIIFPAGGRFDIIQPLNPSPGVTWSGYGATLNALPNFSDLSPIINIQDADRVTVQGLRFTTMRPSGRTFAIGLLNSDYCLLKDYYVGAGFMWGAQVGNINGNGANHCKIDGLVMESSTVVEQIAIIDSNYTVLTNCHLKGTTDVNAIEIFLATPNTCKGTRVINNTFINHGASGVACGGGSGTLVDGNTFLGTGLALIAEQLMVNGVAYPSVSGVFSNNTIESCTITSVQIGPTSYGWSITGNTIKDSQGHGITIFGKSNTVSTNTIIESTMRAISVVGSNNTISGNICLNNRGPAISVHGSGNVITGNQAHDYRDVEFQEYGLIFELGSANNTYGPNDFTENKFGSVFDSGTNNKSVTLQ